MPQPVLFIGSPVENFDAHALVARLAPQFPGLELRASDDPASAPALAPGAGVMVGFGRDFRDAVLAAEPRVEWIQTLTAGTDAVFALKALPAATRVTSMAGVQGPQMAEMAFLHMLNLVRRYQRVLDNQRAHRWERWPQAVLFGKTVVTVGVGGIATEVARRCKAFGMQVVGVTSTPRSAEGFDRMMPRAELAAAAAMADFLIVLVPLSPATRHIIDARILAAMKRSAFLVNIARGGVVDEEALLAALKDGRIAGAGLDVFETEPLPPGSPLWDAPGMLITGHVGGMSEIYNQQMVPVVERNLRCYVEGRWDDMVNVVKR